VFCNIERGLVWRLWLRLFWWSGSRQMASLRVCLAGLRLHQTHSGAAAPPICSSTVELNSPFGAEEICLAAITTPTSRNKSLNRLPSFYLIFLFLYYGVLFVYLHACLAVRMRVAVPHCACVPACVCACVWLCACMRLCVLPCCACACVLCLPCCACARVLCLPACVCVCLCLCACFAMRVAPLARPAALLPRPARPPCRTTGCRTRPCPG
jgi:hypothetical protein